MTGKYFLDTNFLVYSFSGTEPEKRQKCIAWLEEGQERASFVISTQVLNEFIAVMTGKFHKLPLDVKSIVTDLCLFEVVIVNPAIIQQAVDIQVLNKLSFWDSLIISGAKSANCHTILTEDFTNNSSIAGVRIQNPFRV